MVTDQSDFNDNSFQESLVSNTVLADLGATYCTSGNRDLTAAWLRSLGNTVATLPTSLR
jgi:hypothetical protein